MKLLVNLFLAVLIFLAVLPFNYFFENNFNALPIQILIIFFLTLLFFKIKLNKLLLIFASIAVLLLTSNIEFSLLFSSAVTASFIIIWLILISGNLNFTFKKFNHIITILVLIIFIFTIYFNLEFYLESGFNIRSKGFGSGTIFSILSLYSITFIYLLYKNNSLSKFIFYTLFGVFLSTAILTQSRGVLLSILVVFITIEFRDLKNIKWLRLIFIFIIGFVFVFNSSVLNRFNVDQYDDLNQLTSGRSDTQILIIESILMSNDKMTLFFGNGLNSIKELQIKGFEYPHLDLLYLLYEGGLILVFIYIIIMYKIYKIYFNKLIFWIYIISTFHTNMILSPGMLFLGFLFDKAIVIKSVKKRKLQDENNSSISN